MKEAKNGTSKLSIIIGVVVIIAILAVIVVLAIFSKGKVSTTSIPIEENEVMLVETAEDLTPEKEEDMLEESMEEIGDEQTEKSNQEEHEQETIVEVSTEESVKEETEVPVENLSNEEWVKSLNLDKGTFLIFNDISGERKVLEEGQEYKLLEGDELGFWCPIHWLSKRFALDLFTDTSFKYDCSVFDLYLNNITERTEFYVICDDFYTGEEYITTVYLSK